MCGIIGGILSLIQPITTTTTTTTTTSPPTTLTCRGLLLTSSSPIAPEIYEGLGILQHRGQDAAGIITSNRKGRLFQCKGNGMVRDVFSGDALIASLHGSMGVGHVRYPTAGTSSDSEAQPFYVNSPYGLVLAHNGNLTNTGELRAFLDRDVHRHVNTDSDSEVLLNIFASHLQKTGKARVNEEDIFKALSGLYSQCRGGYACIGMVAGYGILAFRDPHGIRPLVRGTRIDPLSQTVETMFASESVALASLGYTDIQDVEPGQAILVTREGTSFRQCTPARTFSPCIFEYVYFARPDSIMDGISVYSARLAMGEALARSVRRKLGEHHDIDVVIPIPDTSRSSALQVSVELGLLYREGLIKNRYIGRTFIMPGQHQRIKSVRRKLNPIVSEFQDRVVLLVDDSIVRGTTSKEIVQMARDAGAKKVYFASCAPPIRYPNVYGIDMPTHEELVAYRRSEDEVAKQIGADCVIYQDIRDLVSSVQKFNPTIETFDISVFNGEYITGDVSPEYFMKLQALRRDASRQELPNQTIGLFNTYK